MDLGDPTVYQGKRLAIEYGVGQPAVPGSAKAFKEEIDMTQFDPGGSLVNGKKLPLDSQVGNYIVTVTANGGTSDNRSFTKLNLRVVDAALLPPPAWTVVDSTIRDDMEKGVFDRERGLAYLSQGANGKAENGCVERWRPIIVMNCSRQAGSLFFASNYLAVCACIGLGVTDSADAPALLRIA
jgi:hypothetical protein